MERESMSEKTSDTSSLNSQELFCITSSLLIWVLRWNVLTKKNLMEELL